MSLRKTCRMVSKEFSNIKHELYKRSYVEQKFVKRSICNVQWRTITIQSTMEVIRKCIEQFFLILFPTIKVNKSFVSQLGSNSTPKAPLRLPSTKLPNPEETAETWTKLLDNPAVKNPTQTLAVLQAILEVSKKHLMESLVMAVHKNTFVVINVS